MNAPARALFSLTAAIAIASFAAAVPAGAQVAPGVNQAFAGRWCVQGDPTRVATITAGLTGLQLTNESGSTSPGQQAGLDPNTITALQWNLVQGTISPSGNRISWTNGTFWVRCRVNAPVAGNTLDGTWYAGGQPGSSCSITQQFGALTFVNENGVSASGNFDGPNHLTANWQGKSIGGTISADGSRISWENGTYWTRTPQS